ncbi:MAG: SDR family oxidoreductase [Candidatus Omnitrophota bacterium]|nr:SDR family oxidoreductase [Candidatus Omnitrophota bacterium]
MNKVVLVTGSLGYLGSRLTAWLRASGYRVIGYDTGFFRDCVLYPPEDPETIQKDMRALTPADLAGVDTIIHLAGMSNDPFGSLTPEEVYDPTRLYTRRLAALCREMGIRLIFASSCSVYGVGGEELVTEESPTFPQTPYSLNKLQIEQDLLAMSDGTFAPIILRFATVFGLSPRMRFDVVINMLVGMALATKRIVLNSDGSAWRPHLEIEDMCEAVARCLELPSRPAQPLLLNVGQTRNNLRILEVAQLIARHVPGCAVEFLSQRRGGEQDTDFELVRDRKIHDGVDTRTYRVSFDRITEALPGFRCRWNVEDGVARLVRELTALGLTAAQCTNRNFYRLQKLEALLNNGALTEELMWRKAPCSMGALAGV